MRATARTFPNSPYDLEEVLTTMGIGEAVVTVLSDKGAPTPVAWTRLCAPRGLMDPAPAGVIAAAVAASPLAPRYATAVDRESAYEMLTARAAKAASSEPGSASGSSSGPSSGSSRGSSSGSSRGSSSKSSPRSEKSGVEQVLESAPVRDFARTAGREIGRSILRSVLGVLKR
jgi:hypothetical protein